MSVAELPEIVRGMFWRLQAKH